MFLLLLGLCFVDLILGQTTGPTQNDSSSFGVGVSQSFPRVYPNNYQQRFISSVPPGNQLMKIQFSAFDVEGYSNAPCTAYDYVLVLDIAAAPNLGPVCDIRNTRLTPSYGVFCNNHMPSFFGKFVNLPSKGVVVEFCSDGLNAYNTGFRYFWLQYQAPTGAPPVTTTAMPTPPPTPTPYLCGNTNTINLVPGTSMVITSPNYPPGPYPNNALCTWNISASNANIHIRTNFFDVESYSNNCNYDYVAVTAHGSTNKYCGSIGVHKYIVSNNALLQFVSDSRVQRLGFNLTVSSPIIPTVGPTVNPMCGSTYALNSVGDTAMITSPGWPGNYPNHANCSWTVTNGMSSSYSVQFSFVTFYTESGYDELLVYQQGAEPVGFDGNATGRNYYFTGSSLNVIFTSDYTITKAGFQIQLSLIPTPFTCPTGAFKCHSSNNCVPAAKRCDGHSDCPDNSDENGPWCKMPNQCGTSQIPPNMYIPGSRIVNGTTAKPGSWPWQVSVHMIQSDGRLFQICGGSLISPHWIISAAHCFYGDTGNPGQFVFKIGSWNKFSMDSPYEVDIQAKGIWIHPHYNPQNHTNDISLIKLATDVPFPFNNHTNGVCIPQPGYIVPANTQCVISGWGTTSSGGRSGPFLQQVVVPVVSNSVCGDGNHYQPGQIDGTMICAGLEQGGKDTCQGDSGGPLVCQNPSTGQWVLQGITSWGRGCAYPHYPGVYARVSALTDFIFNTVNKQD